MCAAGAILGLPCFVLPLLTVGTGRSVLFGGDRRLEVVVVVSRFDGFFWSMVLVTEPVVSLLLYEGAPRERWCGRLAAGSSQVRSLAPVILALICCLLGWVDEVCCRYASSGGAVVSTLLEKLVASLCTWGRGWFVLVAPI